MVVQDEDGSGTAGQGNARDALGRMPAWLAALGDGEQVCRSLTSALVAAGERDTSVLSCEPNRLRLKDGRWAGSYRVVVRSVDDAEPRTVLLLGTEQPVPGPAQAAPLGTRPFGDPAWSTFLPDLGLRLQTEPPEADLPALHLLTDPESARSLLEDGIRRSGLAGAGFRLRSCAPRLLRYKPGSRCTVRYTLEYDEEVASAHWPHVVIVKTYRGGKGRVAWDGLQALWRSPMSQSVVAIAEPIAFIEAHNVLVQRAVPEEETLKQAIRRAVTDGSPAARTELRASLEAAAAGLADLHHSGVTAGTPLAWDDEVAEIRDVAAEVAARVPELAEVVDPLLAMLSDAADGCPADPPGPAHGSFRPAQVLLSRRGPAFIDFDAFCQAEPAVDLALFRTNVRQLSAVPGHRAALAEVADEFLAAYQEQGAVSPRRLALWEALDLLTDVLHCWTKVRPAELAGTISALEAHLVTASPAFG